MRLPEGKFITQETTLFKVMLSPMPYHYPIQLQCTHTHTYIYIYTTNCSNETDYV